MAEAVKFMGVVPEPPPYNICVKTTGTNLNHNECRLQVLKPTDCLTPIKVFFDRNGVAKLTKQKVEIGYVYCDACKKYYSKFDTDGVISWEIQE